MCSRERHCGHGYSGPWQAFSRRVRLRRMVFLRPSSSSTDRANFNTETLMFLGYCHGCCIVASCRVVLLFVGRVCCLSACWKNLEAFCAASDVFTTSYHMDCFYAIGGIGQRATGVRSKESHFDEHRVARNKFARMMDGDFTCRIDHLPTVYRYLQPPAWVDSSFL